MKPGLLVVGELQPWDIEALMDRFDVHLYYAAEDKPGMLARNRETIRAIVTKGEVGCDAAMMDALPRTEIIANYGVGYDLVDVAAAKARGIPVTNTPDVLTEEVADMAFALLLACARRIPAGDRWVRDGSWKTAMMPLQTRVWGKRLGIVGLGRIGSAIARRADAFRMPISYSARQSKGGVPAYRWYSTPAELAPNVDILIVSALGGPTTQGLVDKAAIDALNPGAIFCNVSRGSVVDEAALLAALRERRIAAAGLDVFWNEPDINPEFLTFDHVVLQPHNASGTIETRKDMGRLMLANLEAQFDGKPLPTRVA